MTLAEVLSRCVTIGSAEGIAVAAPVPEQEIRRVWTRFGLEPSADVIELYTLVGGFQNYDFAGEFSW